jgi:hypothetical protein
MYETILGKIDAVAASLDLIRENQRVRQGVNPWGYAGGTREDSTSVQDQVNREEKKKVLVHEGVRNDEGINGEQCSYDGEDKYLAHEWSDHMPDHRMTRHTRSQPRSRTSRYSAM